MPAFAATMSGASGGTVKAAQNATFGSLLVTSAGLTLYHYTPERNGTIRCTTGCENPSDRLSLSPAACAR